MDSSYYLFSSGELKRHDNTLRFIKSDGHKVDIPIEKVYDIYIFGETTINTKLLNFLSRTGIVLHFFNYYEFYTGSFYPREKLVSGDLLVYQVQHYLDFDKRIFLAKKFVAGSAQNILRNLKYYNTRGKNVENAITLIEQLLLELENATDIQQIMGLEGNIRKNYYKEWNTIIDQEINFEKRVKRPPDNMINSLISFMNSLVYTRVLTEIYKTQLNPTISYLHEPSNKRFSLSLDIAEIFKPLLADRLIFSLLNKNMIDETDFDNDYNFLKLKDSALRLILKEFDKRLLTTLKHRTLNKSVSYRYLIRLDLYKLIKHLLGEKEFNSFKIWW
jgi:CRISPR-associated protein Cas1